MNTIFRFFLVCTFFVLAAGAAFAQSTAVSDRLYMFAYGTSFNDSTVYVSAVVPVNGAQVEKKTKFLTDRSAYSAQFKKYLDAQYGKTHTCAVFFGNKRDKVEKKYLKLRKEYTKKKHCKYVEVPVTDFQLTALSSTPQ